MGEGGGEHQEGHQEAEPIAGLGDLEGERRQLDGDARLVDGDVQQARGGRGERGREHLDLQRHRGHDSPRKRRHEQKEADWEGRGPQASATEAPHDESGDDHGHR